MRQRIKVNTSLVGSSDFTRVKSAKAIREINHEQFINSELFMAISQKEPVVVSEPSPSTIVHISVWGKDMRVPYEVAKSMKTTWWL